MVRSNSHIIYVKIKCNMYLISEPKLNMCYLLLPFGSLVTSNNCAEVEMVLLPGLIQGVGLSCEVAVEDQGHKYDQESILLR